MAALTPRVVAGWAALAKRALLLGALAWAMPVLASTGLTDRTRTDLAAQLLALAKQYERGDGLSQDLARAAQLYCDAARYGDAEASFALAWLYGNGQGVPRDERIAASLMARASAAGHPAARQAQRFFGADTQTLPPCIDAVASEATPLAQGQLLVAAESAELDQLVADLPPNKARVAQLIRLLAPQYGIEARLGLAVAAAESNFESLARSPRNAQGVMQLIPETALRFKVRNPFDVTQNIKGGLAYLRWLLAYYRGDVLLALAAYNAGEGAVDRHKGIPPYRETVDYVKRIYAFYGRSSHDFDAKVTDASPILLR